MAQTTRFPYRHLPHWEVEQGRYFITVRCADSLSATPSCDWPDWQKHNA